MPPEQVVERVDTHVSDAEKDGEIPDLHAEYGQEQVTLFGIEGTIDELRDLCPRKAQLDNGEVDRHKQNAFIVRALNESGAAVKKEHFSYISESLAAEGIEVKIIIREETTPKDEPSVPETEKINKTPEETDRHRTDGRGEMLYPTQKTPDRTQEGSEPMSENIVSIDDSRSMVTQVETDDADKDIGINEWFDQMALEYAEYQRELQRVRATSATREAIEEPTALEGASVPTIIAAEEMARVASSDTVKDVTEESEVGAVSTVDSVHTVSDAVETHPEIEEDNAPVAAPTLESVATVLSDNGDILQTESVDYVAEREDVVLAGSHITDAQYPEIEGASSDTYEAIDKQEFPLPEVLQQLFEVDESQEVVPAELSIEDQQKITAEQADATNQDHEFIVQIEAFITEIELKAEEDKESPRRAFVSMLQLAQKIQEKSDDDIVSVALGSELDQSEKLEALKVELYEACEQFLASIGVEPTEEKVQAIMDRILQIDFEKLELEHKFDVRELAQMGTHEYKLEDWFKRAFVSAKQVTPLQLLRTFAMRHVSVDYT